MVQNYSALSRNSLNKINIIKEEIFDGVQGTYGFFMYRNRI